MAVSQLVTPALRADVAEGRRPRPEYLELEAAHGFDLLDWSALGAAGGGRSGTRSARHALAMLRRAGGYDALFSDGEHVGIPLALALRARGTRPRHAVLGHHLTSRSKLPFFKGLRAQAAMDAILVHSPRQQREAATKLGIPAERLRLVPYATDVDFWAPRRQDDEALVVSAGREHRDYATLADACADLGVRVLVADGSLFSPSAVQRRPQAWPANFTARFADYLTLRDWYARAAVVVVPLVPNDFQAGITTVLEAMAMGKAVVVSGTEGLADVVAHDQTAVVVPPGDAAALRAAVARLLADPPERRRLGENAREVAVRDHSIALYAARLAAEVAGRDLAPVAVD